MAVKLNVVINPLCINYFLVSFLLLYHEVLLTSRPSTSASLHKLSSTDRFVMVCGFNKDSVKEYIQVELPDHQAKSDSLLD